MLSGSSHRCGRRRSAHYRPGGSLRLFRSCSGKDIMLLSFFMSISELFDVIFSAFCFSGCRTAQTRTAAASPYCWSSRDCFPDSTPTNALMQGNIDELFRKTDFWNGFLTACFIKKYIFCRYNLLFFLSGGGKFNYQGTKRWLEDNLDHTGTNMASQSKLGSTVRVFHSHLWLINRCLWTCRANIVSMEYNFKIRVSVYFSLIHNYKSRIIHCFLVIFWGISVKQSDYYEKLKLKHIHFKIRVPCIFGLFMIKSPV